MAKQQWAVRLVFPLYEGGRMEYPDPQDFSTSDGFEEARRLCGRAEVRNQAKFQLLGLLAEQLRYMGHARELAHLDAGQPTERRVVEFYCPDPKHIDTRVWADQNAERMRTFGLNAVAAPVWGHRLGFSEASL